MLDAVTQNAVEVRLCSTRLPQIASMSSSSLNSPLINRRPFFSPQDILNLAPRKVDWDLKRDIEGKLAKLERRTQRAIAELIRTCKPESTAAPPLLPLRVPRARAVIPHAAFRITTGERLNDEEEADKFHAAVKAAGSA